jgi:hypothetical protein
MAFPRSALFSRRTALDLVDAMICNLVARWIAFTLPSFSSLPGG